MFEKFSPRIYFLFSVFIILLAAGAMLWMGRLPWCKCGYIKLWHGDTVSSENSQHIADPYIFTHFIHGAGFYLLLRFAARRLPAHWRFVLAIFLESGWEVFENTDFVINRYRAATISLNYYGDTVINSVADILMNALGFYASYKLPVWATALIVVAIEAALLFTIRDSLFLNMLMLIWPIEAVRQWQWGG